MCVNRDWIGGLIGVRVTSIDYQKYRLSGKFQACLFFFLFFLTERFRAQKKTRHTQK